MIAYRSTGMRFYLISVKIFSRVKKSSCKDKYINEIIYVKIVSEALN